MKKYLLDISIVILSLVCIGSLAYFIYYQYEAKTGQDQIEYLKSKMETEEVMNNQVSETEEVMDNQVSDTEKKQSYNNETVEIQQKYKELHEENSDFVGWIKIPGTSVDYPVMQSPNAPIYYEHRGWNGEYSLPGLPIMDSRCTFNSENIIIYSHNMKNGTMFGSLKKYKEWKYFLEHRFIQFSTIYEDREYQIIGIVITKLYDDQENKKDKFVFQNYIELDNKERFNDYINYVKALSLYDTEITPNYGEELITLCTCDYHTEDGRMLVVAKRTR